MTVGMAGAQVGVPWCGTAQLQKAACLWRLSRLVPLLVA